MSTPHTIVAATDFSGNATRAVRQAAFLAQAWDARLVLVHVFNDGVWPSIKSVYDLPGWETIEPVAAARQRLEQLGRELAEEFDIQILPEVMVGRASQLLGETAEALQAGLLVVGEHGESWVSDVMLGGTALKVLEATHIPVLLVRREEPALYRNIIIATDFSAADERAARMALAFFPLAHHMLIHAWRLPFENGLRMSMARSEDVEHYRAHVCADAAVKLERFTKRCEEGATAGKLERLALYGPPAAVLFEQARTRTGDLIVIGKHGGHELRGRLLGSVTQNILYHAECDVLLSA